MKTVGVINQPISFLKTRFRSAIGRPGNHHKIAPPFRAGEWDEQAAILRQRIKPRVKKWVTRALTTMMSAGRSRRNAKPWRDHCDLRPIRREVLRVSAASLGSISIAATRQEEPTSQ